MKPEFEEIKKYKALWEKETQKRINLEGENRTLTRFLEGILNISENWYTHSMDNYMDVQTVMDKYREYKKVR